MITTKKAKLVYREAGVPDLVGRVEHHGNVKGSNKLKHSRLLAVIGSRHFGDEFVMKWGAYAGKAIESPDRSHPENQGVGLSYGPFGDKILQHMREHETLQAALRAGRDGNGATVYVHTNTLPEWVPRERVGGVITTKGDGEPQVVEAAVDLCEFTTADIVDHPAVDLTRQRIGQLLGRLEKDGCVEKR